MPHTAIEMKDVLLNKRTKDAPEVPTSDISRQGDAILAKVLRDAGLRATARSVFFQWPHLEKSSQKFCELISDKYPGADGKPLVVGALQRAFASYVQAYETSIKSTDSLAAFLDSVALSADQAMNYRAIGFDDDGRKKAWAPFAEPLGSWARRTGLAKVRFIQVSPVAKDELIGNRFLLCCHIMSASDIGKVSALQNGTLGAGPQ